MITVRLSLLFSECCDSLERNVRQFVDEAVRLDVSHYCARHIFDFNAPTLKEAKLIKACIERRAENNGWNPNDYTVEIVKQASR